MKENKNKKYWVNIKKTAEDVIPVEVEEKLNTSDASNNENSQINSEMEYTKKAQEISKRRSYELGEVMTEFVGTPFLNPKINEMHDKYDIELAELKKEYNKDTTIEKKDENNYEVKKADIERRREEELKKISFEELENEFKDKTFVGNLIQIQSKFYNNTFRIIGIDEQGDIENKGLDIGVYEGNKNITNFTLPIREKLQSSVFFKYKDSEWSDKDINAKYDAELNELKKILNNTSNGKVEKINEEKREASVEEVALLLKNNKIDQIIIAGEKKSKEKNLKSKEKIFTLKPDLDTLTALYLLNDFNKKSKTETYNDGAVTSTIEKSGEGKDLIEDKNGIKIFLDVSGNWLEVEKDNKTTTIYVDHHGVGKREPTSGTKMMMEIMEKAGILKEKPEWLNKFASFVNDIDNLSYLDKKDNKNRKVFTENYFRNEWPNSLYALAEKQIPFDQLIELCKSGKIKDPSIPFTTEELNGEIGNIKIGDITIKELCAQQKEQVEQVLDGIKNSITNNKKMGLNLETESLGKIIYQDYFKIKGKVNMIPDHLAFKATKAKGFDTYISWNKQKNFFFLNSSNPNLSKVVEELNKVDPECATDVRGVMVFGKIKNLTEEQFLNIIDPKILEGRKIKVESKEPVGQNIDDSKEIERQEKIDKIVEQLTNSILETKELENKLNELINLRKRLVDEYEKEEETQIEIVQDESELSDEQIELKAEDIEIVPDGKESSNGFKELKMEDLDWSYPDYEEKEGKYQLDVGVSIEIREHIYELKENGLVRNLFKMDKKKIKLDKPFYNVYLISMSDNYKELDDMYPSIYLCKNKEEALAKVNEIVKVGLDIKNKKEKAKKIEKKENEEKEKAKRKEELELKIQKDRSNKPFMYFAFEKANNPILLHFNSINELNALDLTNFSNDGHYWEYGVSRGVSDNERFFEFNIFGFILMIKNAKELIDKDGIKYKSDKAVYKIMGPNGKIMADDIKGYDKAESIYKEETEKYKKVVEEAYMNR